MKLDDARVLRWKEENPSPCSWWKSMVYICHGQNYRIGRNVKMKQQLQVIIFLGTKKCVVFTFTDPWNLDLAFKQSHAGTGLKAGRS